MKLQAEIKEIQRCRKEEEKEIEQKKAKRVKEITVGRKIIEENQAAALVKFA